MAGRRPAGEGAVVRRILHVDDSAQMRLSLELAVEHLPDLAVVGAAVDGQAGVEIAADLHPDVIVLDQQMPRLDGVDALPLLRQRCPDARVVMWCNDPEIEDLARERGAADVVDKAAPLDELLAAIRG